MHRPFALALCAVATLVAGSASAHRTISVTQNGHDLAVVVSGVTDYCTNDGDIDILRQGDTIRIVRERPVHVSRCIAARDISLVIHDIPAGTYRMTYEQVPLVAPARPLTLASTTILVSE